jgi:hypothetical protein
MTIENNLILQNPAVIPERDRIQVVMTPAEIIAALESGDYSAEMMMQHLIRNHNRLERERALADRLRKSAQALVDRWETPCWKDAPHTGKFIRSLGDALAAWTEARK